MQNIIVATMKILQWKWSVFYLSIPNSSEGSPVQAAVTHRFLEALVAFTEKNDTFWNNQ